MNALWSTVATAIGTSTGTPFNITDAQSVGGGCINATHVLDDGRRRFFVKLNRADRHEMFAAESEGLAALADARALRIPAVICHGTHSGDAYLVLEHIAFGSGGGAGQTLFGERLAAQHRCTQPRYGWHRDNTIGATPQVNTWRDDWVTFLRDERLGYQYDLAARNGAPGSLIRQGEHLREHLADFFDQPPAASLLHGDLWSGNYSFDDTGAPVIFDPAVYFGDREADLAMTELFGGFGRDFYAAYQSAWPLDAGYRTRKTLYNLYHILNHYNLFGGGYASQALRMTEQLLSECGD